MALLKTNKDIKMKARNKKTITVETLVNAGLEKVWRYWTEPEHIKQWNHASDDWHTPMAENDLQKGGRFTCRMEAKDGSFGFDFVGTYNKILPKKFIGYTLDDGRIVTIDFEDKDGKIMITEIFEPEDQNPVDMQRDGWQAILDNFKNYTEKSEAQ